MARTSSAWSEALSRVLPDEVAHEEIAVVDRTGRRWHDLRISPLQHQTGRLTGRLVVIRDITRRKGVERERELLIEELDAFAHSVAHDLKTSLTSILNGITRDSVFTLAVEMGYRVVEDRFTRDELYIADEAFFTGTAAEITPIREVDDRTIGEGRPGPVPVFEALMSLN